MEKIKQLENDIIKHKSKYYQGNPEISDFDYDKLEQELKEIDPRNPVLDIVGSDQFVGEKIQHDKKMLSLNKSYKLEELLSWKDNYDIVSTYKIDGSSCSLVYHNGKLALAKTRGNGTFGENITNKILFIEHIPRLLKGQTINCEIRGEVFCREEDFFHLSKKMVEMGLERPTSQRNIVAGLLGRKENIDLCEYLSFQAFELISSDVELKTEVEKYKLIRQMGFETPEFFLNKTKTEIENRLEEARQFMSEGDYLIDGLVFTYNDIGVHDSLGETAHHPRYKMAFKFQGETKSTFINEISWQVSRNGVLTPVANVEPVELSGAMVSRVTLHNYGMVNQYQLKRGDEIEIVRSGEVIPKFLSVIKSSNALFETPKKCPSCSKEVVIEDIRIYCHNNACPDKILDNILNFIQKIGIDDISSKRLFEMIDKGFVKDAASLYELTMENLLTLDKTKEKLAQKIIDNIAKTKNVDLITFLSALGISGGAYNKCEKIVNSGYDSLDSILKLNVESLSEVESFAEKSAGDFINSLESKNELIKRLLKNGVSIKKKVKIESNISGLAFCITGSLSMKRSDLQKMIVSNGGHFVSSVSKNTDYLVTNDLESSSSKFKKAKQLEIPIINEEKFLAMLEVKNGESKK